MIVLRVPLNTKLTQTPLVHSQLRSFARAHNSSGVCAERIERRVVRHSCMYMAVRNFMTDIQSVTGQRKGIWSFWSPIIEQVMF